MKYFTANAGDIRDAGLIPVLGKSLGVGNGNPFHYFCLENPWTEEPGRLQSVGTEGPLNPFPHVGFTHSSPAPRPPPGGSRQRPQHLRLNFQSLSPCPQAGAYSPGPAGHEPVKQTKVCCVNTARTHYRYYMHTHTHTPFLPGPSVSLLRRYHQATLEVRKLRLGETVDTSKC